MLNWAQIKAKLCVSDLGRLYFGLNYQLIQKPHRRGLYYSQVIIYLHRLHRLHRESIKQMPRTQFTLHSGNFVEPFKIL